MSSLGSIPSMSTTETGKAEYINPFKLIEDMYPASVDSASETAASAAGTASVNSTPSEVRSTTPQNLLVNARDVDPETGTRIATMESLEARPPVYSQHSAQSDVKPTVHGHANRKALEEKIAVIGDHVIGLQDVLPEATIQSLLNDLTQLGTQTLAGIDGDAVTIADDEEQVRKPAPVPECQAESILRRVLPAAKTTASTLRSALKGSRPKRNPSVYTDRSRESVKVYSGPTENSGFRVGSHVKKALQYCKVSIDGKLAEMETWTDLTNGGVAIQLAGLQVLVYGPWRDICTKVYTKFMEDDPGLSCKVSCIQNDSGVSIYAVNVRPVTTSELNYMPFAIIAHDVAKGTAETEVLKKSLDFRTVRIISGED